MFKCFINVIAVFLENKLFKIQLNLEEHNMQIRTIKINNKYLILNINIA